jgi:hypothetical protein
MNYSFIEGLCANLPERARAREGAPPIPCVVRPPGLESAQYCCKFFFFFFARNK